MNFINQGPGLEHKFCQFGDDISLRAGTEISGYASLFGKTDNGGDVVEKGAYAQSLKALGASGRRVKMLWQHDPTMPIGIWDEVREDDKGLYVKGRVLKDVRQGAEALSLIKAGAIDGLSIGYRTKRAEKDAKGRRLLAEVELWEVSLVTFPMLPEARVTSEAEAGEDALAQELAEAFADARNMLA